MMGGTKPAPVNADALTVEGLAGQLYTHASGSGFFVWWHLLRPEVRRVYRDLARQQIAEFNRGNAAPWDEEV